MSLTYWGCVLLVHSLLDLHGLLEIGKVGYAEIFEERASVLDHRLGPGVEVVRLSLSLLENGRGKVPGGLLEVALEGASILLGAQWQLGQLLEGILIGRLEQRVLDSGGSETPMRVHHLVQSGEESHILLCILMSSLKLGNALAKESELDSGLDVEGERLHRHGLVADEHLLAAVDLVLEAVLDELHRGTKIELCLHEGKCGNGGREPPLSVEELNVSPFLQFEDRCHVGLRHLVDEDLHGVGHGPAVSLAASLDGPNDDSPLLIGRLYHKPSVVWLEETLDELFLQ